MSESANMQRLKAAYRAWSETKGEEPNAWLDLMTDGVRIHTVNEESAGMEFARDCASKVEAVGYLTGITKDWQMVHWTPDVFLEDGDRIAMFGRCAWAYRATGQQVEVDIAHLWRFADGGVVELLEVFDSAKPVSIAMTGRTAAPPSGA